jgi:hypothetical protein
LPSKGVPDKSYRSYLKSACGWVGTSLKILEILMYSCGFQLGTAAPVSAQPSGENGTLNQNPIFEMAFRYNQSQPGWINPETILSK